ncbi:MAG: hypothetical protein AAGF96_13175 [Bacteroidota bacterium]
MDLEKTKKIVQAHPFLSGKTVNGVKTDELLIYPPDEVFYSVFIAMYCTTLNNEESLRPFVAEEMGVNYIGRFREGFVRYPKWFLL